MSAYLAAEIDATGAVGDMLRAVLLFLPRALAFITILVVGWLIAKAVRKIVDKILERVGFDQAVERGGVKTALARSNYDASDIVAKLAFYAVLLFTLQLAFGVWGDNPISALITAVVAWIPRAFVAIVIVVIAAAIASAVKDLITGALGGLSYGRLLANVASVFILGLGVIAALNQIGVATTVTTPILIAVLATIAGILIVGVGGGLIRPMQSRWETWLHVAERETQLIAEHSRAYAVGQREARGELTRPAGYPTAGGQPASPDETQPVAYAMPDESEADRTQAVSYPAPVEPEADRTQAVAYPASGSPVNPADQTQPIRYPTPATHGGPVVDSDPTIVLPTPPRAGEARH